MGDRRSSPAFKTRLNVTNHCLLGARSMFSVYQLLGSKQRLMLRDVASRGPWVSAHPDIILQMGVKEVLYRTKHLGWSTDTHLYRGVAAFRAAFPARLGSAGPRVLKQNRGNGGQGVWKVEPIGAGRVRVLHAQRGSVPEDMALGDFMARCEAYLTPDGCIVDQPFQVRLPDGMIRCYMGADKVVGYGHQRVKALIPPPPEGPDSPEAQPGPRIMHGADAAPFQALRVKMETEWVPGMMATLPVSGCLTPKLTPLEWADRARCSRDGPRAL